DLQLAHLHRLLPGGAGAAQRAAPVAGEEAQPAPRELPVLRRVEPAVRGAALALDRDRLVGGAEDRRHRRAGPAPALHARLGRGQPRAARLLQVRRLRAGELPAGARGGGGAVRPARARHRAPGGHLVLHVPDDVVHARRVPGARAAGVELPGLRALRDLLPAARRGADRAAHGPGAAVRRAAHRDAEAARVGAAAHDDRPVREGRGRRRAPRARRRRRVRRDRRGADARRLARHPGLLGADLLRLRRLHHHRDRRLARARLLAHRQLPLPVRGDRLLRLLAPLAHLALHLAARLPLHPARRQPRHHRAHLRQPHAHDAPGRALARRGVDLRGVGRAARALPGGGAVPQAAARAARRLAHRRRPARARAADVPARERHLGLLPRPRLRHRHARALEHGRARARRAAGAHLVAGGQRHRDDRPDARRALAHAPPRAARRGRALAGRGGGRRVGADALRPRDHPGGERCLHLLPVL
ncbi:MAG: Probable poly(beta-D-mannuronate) O-acetylase, partial [uncultured Gemmatimonadaceae bacterium]